MIIFLENKINIAIRIGISNVIQEQTVKPFLLINARRDVSKTAALKSGVDDISDNMKYGSIVYVDKDLIPYAHRNSSKYKHMAPKIEGDNFYMQRKSDEAVEALLKKEFEYSVLSETLKRVVKKSESNSNYGSGDYGIMIDGLTLDEIFELKKQMENMPNLSNNIIVISSSSKSGATHISSIDAIESTLNSIFKPADIDFSEMAMTGKLIWSTDSEFPVVMRVEKDEVKKDNSANELNIEVEDANGFAMMYGSAGQAHPEMAA